MSGTSLDGIDAAVLESDGQNIVNFGPALSVEYSSRQRAQLRTALVYAAKLRPTVTDSPTILKIERMLTIAHARVVRLLLRKAGLSTARIDLIGFHGQTILHRPIERRTWQIGDGALLSKLTRIDVVNDFRSADVAAGGEGAPLVPLYHAARVRAAQIGLPVAVLNLGGIANVTYIGRDEIVAFDTGPGNAPLDDWALKNCGVPIDENGNLARAGKVDEMALSHLLKHPFFERRPPKSLDRMEFGFELVAKLSPTDGAATLTAFVAEGVARACNYFPTTVPCWIVCGGGRHNLSIMAELRKRVSGEFYFAEDYNWRGDFIEAEAFAYLAIRSQNGMALTLPTTTGVSTPQLGGKFYSSKPDKETIQPFNFKRLD